jgi:hypothetical protein
VCAAAGFVHPGLVEFFKCPFATNHGLVRCQQDNIVSKECGTPCRITLVKSLVIRSVKVFQYLFRL